MKKEPPVPSRKQFVILVLFQEVITMNAKYKFDAVSFGMRLAKIREFNQMTQEKVAEILGVNVKSVQNWELGKKMPAIDNMVAIANCYNMTVGEILEDEAYRIFEKKADARKRTIEILEVAGRIETFIEFAEDRYFDRYEAWIWDDLACYKYMCVSVEKIISYEEFKRYVFEQIDSFVKEYREWWLDNLTESEEDELVKSEILNKTKMEEAGMAAKGAVLVNGGVIYFDVDERE